MMEHLASIEAIARAGILALALGIAESAFLAAAVSLAIRCWRPSATTRHVMWWMVLVAATVLPLASFGASLRHIEHRRAPAAVTERVAATPSRAAGARARRNGRMTIDITFAPQREDVASHVASARPFATTLLTNALAAFAFFGAIPFAATALALAWLTVAMVALAALARSLVGLCRIKRDAVPLDESVLRRLRRFRHSTRIGRPVAVRVSNDVDVPVAVGFRTPTILLPARVVEAEAIPDIDQIAMHEYAHLDRYDDWTNLLQRGIERVFWFNPVILFVGRNISLEREIACDDWVIAQTGRAHRYATCLWKLVESSRLPSAPIVAPGALLSARQITVRIEQLLDSRRNALPRLSPFGALAVGALCATLVVVQTLRAPAIALVDIDSSSAVVTGMHVPAALQTEPQSAPSPKPEPKTFLFERRDVRVAVDASPGVVASAIATAVAANERAVVKATVATRVSDPAANAASFGAGLGLDIATHVLRSMRVAVAGPEEAYGGRLDRARLERCFGCDLHGADLRNIDLHGINLMGVDLHDADMRGANLRDAKFTGADLRHVRLAGADARGATFTGCDLGDTDLTRASLDGARIVGTSIRGANLSGTRLRSLVDGCSGCDLRGLDLHGQDLRGIKLVGVDLRDANLRGADVSDARFEAVDFRGADVAGLKLDRAIFRYCNVRGLTLRNARIVDGRAFSGDPPPAPELPEIP